jgi:cyclopropane-fatty-acyl-phospholipid synthase
MDAALRDAGTSPAAIAHHYDLSDEFFALWLGEDLVYSCALWNTNDPADRLGTAQRRKLDFFAAHLGVAGRRVLDIGCGWGALLDRFNDAHGLAGGVGLTLSDAQAAAARARRVPGVDFRVESWVDHRPVASYDAITCIEMTEHLASDRLTADQKVDVYRAFFERCAGWLTDEGRLGLQLICLDNVGHEGSRAGRGASSELIRLAIFPESMPASLSELVLGWETHFEVERFLDHPDHYQRTFRAMRLRGRSRATSPSARRSSASAKTRCTGSS